MNQSRCWAKERGDSGVRGRGAMVRAGTSPDALPWSMRSSSARLAAESPAAREVASTLIAHPSENPGVALQPQPGIVLRHRFQFLHQQLLHRRGQRGEGGALEEAP